MKKENVGAMIAARRRDKGLTQQELAALLGVTNKAVSKWETGKGMPDVSLLPALSAALGTSIDELLADKTAETEAPAGTPLRPALFKLEFARDLRRLVQQSRAAHLAFGKKYALLGAGCLFLCIALCAGLLVAPMVYLSRWPIGLALALALVALAGCVFVYRLRARRLYKTARRENGGDSTVTIVFYDEDFMVQTAATRREFGYTDIEAIALYSGAAVLRCRGEEYLLLPQDMVSGTAEGLLVFLKARAPKARVVQPKGKRWLQLVGAALLASAGGCIAIMQVGYLTVGRANRFEYLYDFLPALFNCGIILLLLAAGLLVWHKGWKPFAVLGGAAALLLCINLGFASFNSGQVTITDTSPSGIQFIVKIDPVTNRANLCRRRFLWFVQPKETLAHPVTGARLKTQWLADDICMVTYRSLYSDAPQVYVATYSTRGAGWYSTAGTIGEGSWMAPKSMREWSFSYEDRAFTVANYGQASVYPSENCMQYGSTALVLYNDEGLAEWVVAMGTDCKVDGGSLEGGTIYLCAVSMSPTTPIPFTNGAQSSYFEAMR